MGTAKRGETDVVNPDEVDLGELPSVAFERRRDLPHDSAVYFVCDVSGVLYIGRSRRLVQRWMAHHRSIQLRRLENIRIAWLNAPEENLEDLERRLIERLNPPLNGSPVENPNAERIDLRVTPDVKRAIEEMARERRVSVNWMTEDLLLCAFSYYPNWSDPPSAGEEKAHE